MVDATKLARDIINKYPEVSSRPLEGNKIELIVPVPAIRNVITMIDELLPDALPEAAFGIDLENDKYEVLYIIWSHESRLLCQIRVALEGENPEIETVSDIFPGFDWHERETSEMFGIMFNHHPDPRPLLLPDELVGEYPMRKRFVTDRSRIEETGLSTPRPRTTSGGEES